MLRNKIALIISVTFLVFSTSKAANINNEFSADAVMTIPGQPRTVSKLFIGKDSVRTEVNTENGVMVDIVFPKEGRLIKLNPAVKEYIEIPIEKNNEDKDSKNNPCNRIQNSTCTLMGNETINGQETNKWKIVSIKDGKTIRTLHWVDTKRQLAVREFFSDGSMAEMTLQKAEKINNRKTEKWVRRVSRPDGSSISSYQWYDPLLEISIKEELPGGYIRELKNINMGSQNKSLFKIPENYKVIKQNTQQISPTNGYRQIK